MKNLKRLKEQIEQLIESGIDENELVYDYENTEYAVSNIEYDKEENKIYIKFE